MSFDVFAVLKFMIGAMLVLTAVVLVAYFLVIRPAIRRQKLDPAHLAGLSLRDDDLLRLADVFELAADVCGSREAGARWMLTPHEELAYKAPVMMIESDHGWLAVRAILRRARHGIPA